MDTEGLDQTESTQDLRILYSIVHRMLAILQCHFGGYVVFTDEFANQFYLKLRGWAEERSAHFPRIKDALADLTDFYPNLWEFYEEHDWKSDELSLVNPLMARLSEAVVAAGSRLEEQLPEEWTEIFAGVDSLIKMKREKQRRREERFFGKDVAVQLSPDEEQEFERLGFKSRLPIRITGRTERRNSNVIDVTGHRVVLTDAPFRMFLRLVVALCETPDGFLSRSDLRYGTGIDGETDLAPEGLDQALSRLRAPFQPALEGLERTDFIETSSGRFRLSTHRRYVTWDRKALLGHQDKWVPRIAARLPEE